MNAIRRDETEFRHWQEAAKLAAFSGMGLIWKIVLRGNSNIERLRTTARTFAGSPLAMHRSFVSRLAESGEDAFCDFVGRWLATDYAGRKPVEEVISMLFLVTGRDDDIRMFFSKALSCPDVCQELHLAREGSADEELLAAVEDFEIRASKGEGDDWDRGFMRSLSFDPFVDLTYPIYCGYMRQMQFEAARKLFSRQFDTQSMRILIARFQDEFGPIEHPDAWEELIQ